VPLRAADPRQIVGASRLRLLDAWWQIMASTIVGFMAPSGPENSSIGLLCEADLTKPDIIETAAGDPYRNSLLSDEPLLLTYCPLRGGGLAKMPALSNRCDERLTLGRNEDDHYFCWYIAITLMNDTRRLHERVSGPECARGITIQRRRRPAPGRTPQPHHCRRKPRVPNVRFDPL
jgi:hypothetical protein